MTSSNSSNRLLRITIMLVGAAVVATIAAFAASGPWQKPVRAWAIRGLGGTPAGEQAPAGPSADDHQPPDEHVHEADGHGHAGHAEENSIELSAQARRSIGLEEGGVGLSTFQRTITVPGMVVERRGRSRFTIIAPMTGYLTRILVTEGDAIAPDQPLFEIRLTHEELVQAQADLLRTTAEVDVVRREIARLEGIGPAGLIPVKTILERKYELEKLEAVQLAQRQALLLHGLTEPQVENITSARTLLGSITVRAAGAAALDGRSDKLLVQSLTVDRGQHVTAGETLAVLVDHATLLVEGDAFEQDIPAITDAATAGKPITAVLDAPGGLGRQVEGLQIAYVADRVAPESRTLRFYVTLPNEAVAEPRADGTNRLMTWRYKPGQRMQLQVPVEEWTERIVLPAQAVAQDGVENYVFRANGDHFDREPVHVEHRDPQWVVIANDGTLFPGDRVAMSAAQQLQLAIKNKSGGGIDPHAGHNH
ncbi:MAG: efflux RND transporter periplasmic adaptor subunit [Planctomycetia bacterium]|nr:efflux RND transporter periplasmic adaptor subunit [Planctomycetia bacterium]